MKIKIYKSKVDAMQEYMKYSKKLVSELQNIRDTKTLLVTEYDKVPEKLDSLVELRRKLAIANDFTEKDYYNTRDFVRWLNDEEYEKLIDFEVDESR